MGRNKDKRGFSVREASEYTGLAAKTIYNAIARGDRSFPRPRRCGRKVIFLKEDLDAWLENLPESEKAH